MRHADRRRRQRHLLRRRAHDDDGRRRQQRFRLLRTGANTIADFAASSTNDIILSDSGFALDIAGASSSPQALPTNLFNSDGSGTFTNATQRFSYNSTSGQLLFDADGNGGGSATKLVATLTGAPALAAAHLLYIG